jgi:hypothetical protein
MAAADRVQVRLRTTRGSSIRALDPARLRQSVFRGADAIYSPMASEPVILGSCLVWFPDLPQYGRTQSGAPMHHPAEISAKKKAELDNSMPS